VRDLLLTLAVALVIGLIVFGAVAFTLGKATGLAPVDPDAAPHELPPDAAVKPADVEAVRFDVVLRGYRMDQVDTVLERLTYDLGVRDDEIRALREELRASRSDSVGTTTEVISIPAGALDGPTAPAGALDDPVAPAGALDGSVASVSGTPAEARERHGDDQPSG
jgi:DivIVA domain-containing protein